MGPGEILGWLEGRVVSGRWSSAAAFQWRRGGGLGYGGVACTREELAVAFYRRRPRRVEAIKRDGGPVGASGRGRRGGRVARGGGRLRRAG
jgi:hypothetical protein